MAGILGRSGEMDASRQRARRPVRFQPGSEALEGRQLLTGGLRASSLSKAALYSLLHDPVGTPAVRPNTPVLPYGTPAKLATFIDPTSRITNGNAVIVSAPGFIGPYTTLNANRGAIKIGIGSYILDNASIVANPTGAKGGTVPQVRIGNQVQIGYGAKVLGVSTIGAYGSSVQPTRIGDGAVVDGATVAQGAIVSTLAYVGPGVTVPTGFRVLPGKSVTSDAEASDPALGKVVPVTADDLSKLNKSMATNLALAQGYSTLYQGQSATGASPGVEPTVSGIYNGNLAAVSGTSAQPGVPTAFLPPGTSPKFPAPHRASVPAGFFNFRARVAGGVVFNARANTVNNSVGRGNSFRADIGQPITIGSIARTGNGVTINSPGGGQMTIGQNLVANSFSTILGDAATRVTIGDDVVIGTGAVLEGTSLGSDSVVGDRAYLLNSTFPAGTQIPAGAIYINNVRVGTIEW